MARATRRIAARRDRRGVRALTLPTALLLLVAAPAHAATPRSWFVPPVPGAVTARFQAPVSAWGPGHRGVDYAVPEGSHVTAAAPGTVTFAGSVGDAQAVTVAHPGGIETTYSDLAAVRVVAGRQVAEGTIVGLSGDAHPGEPGVHLGMKIDGRYVDPLDHLARLDMTGAIHLAPLAWEPPSALAGIVAISAGSSEDPCENPGSLPERPPPPNDNVAVAVAGIGSSTADGVHADMYEHGPEELGYAPSDVYRFSYRGPRGPRLHQPYRATDTYGDIRGAAAALRATLVRVAQEHPGRDVDLIAHSQGGIVSRTLLAELAEAGDPQLPRIAHFVTFASPHSGATGAGEVADLEDSLMGRALVRAASRWSDAGGPMPDPMSPAVGQLAPGSGLMRALAREELVAGTRGLALAIPNDLIVPADRAGLPGHLNRMVGPTGGRAMGELAADVADRLGPPLLGGALRAAFGGRPLEDLNAHSAIVAKDEARAIAYSFLRDAPDPCLRPVDGWGREAGRVVSAVEGSLGDLVSGPERIVRGIGSYAAARIERDVSALRSAGAGAWRIARMLP